MNYAHRFFLALLWLYPPRFRRQFAREMSATFAQAYHTQTGLVGRVRLLGKTVVQVFVFAALEWSDVMLRFRPRSRYPPSASGGSTLPFTEHVMSVLSDLRLAVRTLPRRPTFTIPAIVTLALGIGANTAVFSVVDGILWRPLNYADSDRLVRLWPDHSMNTREVVFLREHGRDVFESVAFASGWSLPISGIDQPTQVAGSRISANLFATLGTPAWLGRTFVSADGLVGADPVVVLSHRIWATRFGADTTILGRSVTILGFQHEVVGVMAPDFEILDPAWELWIPLPRDERHWTYTANMSRVIARLAPDVTIEQARQGFARMLSAFRDTYGMPGTYGQGAAIVDLKGSLVGDYRTSFWVLLGAVGFILLIAGSNLSNLMLVKAAGHRREMALRAALGATRRRLAQLVVTEALALAMAGGALGLVLAYGGVELVQGLVPTDTPRAGGISVDGRVLMVCFMASVATGLLFSVIPASVATRTNLRRDVSQARIVGVTGHKGRTFHNSWVTVQIALAVMLVVGASLMVQTIRGLIAVDPGFDDEHVLTLRLHPTGPAYDTPEEYRSFYDALSERVAAIPGVVRLGGVQHLPFSGSSWGIPFESVAAPIAEGQSKPVAGWRIVMGDYLEAMRIPLIEGRSFLPSDRADAEQVALVNRAFAERFQSSGSVLGEQLRLGTQGETTVTVVGVVDDVHYEALNVAPGADIYRPLSQSTMPAIMLAVRTNADSEGIARSVQALIREIDSDMPVSHVMPLHSLVLESLGRTRLVMTLLTTFALVALALGAVGVYSVTAFIVNQRTNEFGIRKALGASEGRVRRQVLRQGMSSALVGTAIGLAGAAALGGFLRDLVYQIQPTDPLTFAFVSALMLVVAALACIIPAWRATRIDPARALRNM